MEANSNVSPAVVDKIREIVVKAAERLMNRWTAIAVERFMRPSGGGPPVPGKLTIRTGRLANSLLGRAESKDSVQLSEKALVYTRTVTVPYAARHEFGLGPDAGVTQPVTRAMRGHFLWMYKETGDEMYKRFAFPKAGVLRIISPARPYAAPAEARLMEEAQKILDQTISMGVARG